MNIEPLIIPAKKVKKTENMTTYMREYMKNKYSEDPDAIRGRNKIYYYKNKSGLDSGKIKQYGDRFPYVAKVKIAINELYIKDAIVAIDILTEYLQELREKYEEL
jgi:hypothetical protein